MQQPNLLCEQTRKHAVREEVAKETPNPTKCPFLAARVAFENEVIANATMLSGGMTNAMRSLRVPTLRPEFAWAIAFTKYWTEYKPTQSAITFESNDAFLARLKSAIDVSPFFKWRFENESLERDKQISFTTWFLRQSIAFIRQDHHLLVVLEVLRSATMQQLEELSILYPNLFLSDAMALCPAFSTFALTHQSFDAINERGVVDTAFRSVDFATQQEFFNDNLRDRSASILSPFFTNHKAFASDYFLSQLPNNLTPALLQHYLNTKLLAFLEDDLKLINTARSYEVAKRKLALSRITKHMQHLRTAFTDCTAEALAANIRIFAVIVTPELLLSLIRRDVDNLTECLMQNYALYEQFFFGEHAIVAQLDFAQPNLAARFVQHIPVKQGLKLSDSQLAALAKRTDEPTLVWLVKYFPINPQSLINLMLQERHLLDYVLANPMVTIIDSLMSAEFPFDAQRPVSLLISAMNKLSKYYPLTKEQLVRMLRLCDDTITDWLFKNEIQFPAIQEIKRDASLCTTLREINPRFLAHTITAENTTQETFFDLILANPAFIIRALKATPTALQVYISNVQRTLENHINPGPIRAALRTASVTITRDPVLPAAARANDPNDAMMNNIRQVQKAVTEGELDFDKLLILSTKKKDLDRLVILFVLFTYNTDSATVGDYEIKKQPARIAVGEMLINECLEAQNYNMLTLVMSHNEVIFKVTKKLFSANIEEKIEYLEPLKNCFLKRLGNLTTTQLLDLLSHKILCAVCVKNYKDYVKNLLCQRAERDNTFTLQLLINPERRVALDSCVTLPDEQQALLVNICNRTENVCDILLSSPTLLAWASSKHQQHIKHLIVQAIDTGKLAIETILRSPELTQLFTPGELLARLTPVTAKLGLHYRHILKLFNEEANLSKLLQKANISAKTLLENKLFELESADSSNFDYVYTRTLLRRLNGEDIALPKQPPVSPVGSFLSLGSSNSQIKPAATAAERLVPPSRQSTDSIEISSPISAAAAKQSGSDIARAPAPLVRTESLSAASPKSPSSGSAITNAPPTPPVRSSVASSPDSPPPAPSANTSPISSVVLPTSPMSTALVSEVSSQPAAEAALVPPPLTSEVALPAAVSSPTTDLSNANKEASEKPTPPSVLASVASQTLPVTDATGPSAAAVSALSPSPLTDAENKEQPVAPAPSEPKAAAPKSPPPPPIIKAPPPPPAKKPAAAPEGAATQPGRTNLLADIANLGAARRVKPAAKPAAKGPGLFDNSAAAAAASADNSASTTQAIDAELILFIETKIGNAKKKEIETHITPLINAIRTADPSAYEKLIEQLTEKLSALTKSGLASTLALAMSSRRNAMRPASTYEEESPADGNKDDWDESKSNNETTAATSASSSTAAKSSVDSKTAAIIAEVRRLYPCPAPSATPMQ